MFAVQHWSGPEGPFSSSRTQINPGGAKLFESLPGPLLKSGQEPLLRYGTHHTINGRLEQAYLPSDSRLEWPGEGSLGNI